MDLSVKIKELGLKVRPTVSPENVREFEARLGVNLPEEYVLFVTEIGDGWEKQVVRRRLWQEMKSMVSHEDMSVLCKPFPYTEAWVWEGRETNPLPGECDEAWNKRVDELLRPKSFGNIPLMRGSHGEVFHLILNGKCSGEIWEFTDVGIAPCAPRVTFLEWITTWIESKSPV